MLPSTEVFKPSIDNIFVNLQNVEREMGYTQNNIPDDFRDMLIGLNIEARKQVNLCCSCTYFPPGSATAGPGQVEIDGVLFKTGKIISGQIKKMEGAAIFTASLGPRFDIWSKQFFDQGDPISAFIADLLGSEMAESLADWIEERIAEKAALENLGHSNRYSPGYCGWDVFEQHKLFGLLPKNVCGIALTESALMQPIKSVSGIIALGEQIVKKEYQCHICDADFCYKRSDIRKTKVI